MGSMRYCRFRNTENEVDECINALNNGEKLSEDEFLAARRMVKSMFDFIYELGAIDNVDEKNALKEIDLYFEDYKKSNCDMEDDEDGK